MRIRKKIRKFRQGQSYSIFVGVFWALIAYEIVCTIIYM